MIRLRPIAAPISPEDAGFLRDLHHRAYRDVVERQFGGWNELEQDRWLAIELSEGGFSVVEEDGVAVGAISTREQADCLLLLELQIVPERQGRGLGTALLQAELERARQLGKPLRLRVLLQNRARSLYARHGFVVTGLTDTHYEMECL